jgi:DNA-binding MarR family transcriptional regulator
VSGATTDRDIMENGTGDVAPLTGDEEAFLRAFGRACLILPRELDADLLREQRMSLSDYQTLMNLSDAPGRRLRMSDLAAISALSVSGMTRIVDRLPGAGLVERERPAGDGRGWHAVLTDSGLERLRQSWPTHIASVRWHFFGYLAGVDLRPVTHARQRLAADSKSRTVSRDCDEEGDPMASGERRG